jgi:CDP-glucose 4,6-dehydratase
VLVVTTDKVYAHGARRDFKEGDALGGRDPYSASKAAAELIVRSFAATWFEPAGVKLATARAGNAIGGGDWAEDRLVPDVWRAARTGRPLLLRAPDSVRPWQHVLEPLAGYLRLVEALARGDDVPPALNFGPAPGEQLTVAELATLVGDALGLAEPWRADESRHPPETEYLALDADLARTTIGWAPRLDAREAAEWTSAWYAAYADGASARALCLDQISRYEALA